MKVPDFYLLFIFKLNFLAHLDRIDIGTDPAHTSSIDDFHALAKRARTHARTHARMHARTHAHAQTDRQTDRQRERERERERDGH